MVNAKNEYSIDSLYVKLQYKRTIQQDMFHYIIKPLTMWANDELNVKHNPYFALWEAHEPAMICLLCTISLYVWDSVQF